MLLSDASFVSPESLKFSFSVKLVVTFTVAFQFSSIFISVSLCFLRYPFIVEMILFAESVFEKAITYLFPTSLAIA